MPTRTIVKNIAEQIIEEQLFAKDANTGVIDARVVVAVSGGPDSMALLHILLALNEEADFNLTLHVAHLNHCLRGADSDEDAAFVQAAADSLNLESTILARNIPALAGQTSGSIEEIARNERYHFLERVAIQTRSIAAAVGHHADDNAETILHRILRGTGIRGLSGIPRRRSISPMSDVEIVRPLLRVMRKDILQFLSDRGVPFREDRTNELNEPMRNRIRNMILPTVKTEVNPQVVDALLRLGEQAGWVEQYLRETAHRTFETLIINRTDQDLTLNITSLARKNRIIQTELVRRAIDFFEVGQQDLSFTHIKSVLDLIASSESGKQVQLPGGISATKLYDRLIFAMHTDEPREEIASEIAIHVPGTTNLPVRRMEIECTVRDVKTADIERWRVEKQEYAEKHPYFDKCTHAEKHAFEEWIDLDRVSLPLTVRQRRPGDRFWPLGAPGSKKLSEFLIDTKVDPAERDRVAVLSDQLGPVWIVGHRLDERVKLTRQTRRVLVLSVRRFEGEE